MAEDIEDIGFEYIDSKVSFALEQPYDVSKQLIIDLLMEVKFKTAQRLMRLN